jgi:prepilin-type N-terminal cleavage/methylation domain-containing protein
MRANHRGFTLIEIIFSLAITFVILASFYDLTAFLHRDYTRQGALAESLQESRVATSFFQNEVQNAEQVIEASETTFHFIKGNIIRYEWTGKKPHKKTQMPYTLYREIGQGGLQEVALGIASFKLSYFDENGNPLPKGILAQGERMKIRKVLLTLKPAEKGIENGGRREWTSEIYLKNIG